MIMGFKTRLLKVGGTHNARAPLSTVRARVVSVHRKLLLTHITRYIHDWSIYKIMYGITYSLHGTGVRL